jgi:predicted ATPase/class 3 adenylate cyclase
MVDLPSGTVTLLFSDIEGSTLLLARLGPAYADAVDGQRRVLRQAWAQHGGIELGTEGDSFFVVFPTALGAAAAAVQAQRDLHGYAWPGGERVRVRMGIHTGSPTVHDGSYVGMDVHRAARISGAAHGGQVVVSQATTHLIEGGLPSGVTLRDLGRHQLKSLESTEHLYQLVIDGLPNDFPPLKSLGAASSLPRPTTSLVGRDREMATLATLLDSPDVRLVTLTGPGGSGKTRLATEVARRMVNHFPDGVFFIPLASVTTADLMWKAIAEVLDVPPEQRTPEGLFEHAAHYSALFVLDNLEQFPDADQAVAHLLNMAAEIVVIATSRRPLHVAGEREHPVPPLELAAGTDAQAASASGAVQMFVEHARMVHPGFELTEDNVADVVELCRRLDGLPLAIELVAARIKLLTPTALLARFDKALDIAARSSQAPTRQKTLREAIGWSHDLLSPVQRTFFRRLGVFVGGADLEAITAVNADILDSADPLDLVADLVDASLATITGGVGGEPRISVLQIIRAYALDELTASGELDSIRMRHAQHYLELVQELSLLLHGEHYPVARMRFEIDHDNIRAALAWAVEPNEAADRNELQLAMQRWKW